MRIHGKSKNCSYSLGNEISLVRGPKYWKIDQDGNYKGEGKEDILGGGGV